MITKKLDALLVPYPNLEWREDKDEMNEPYWTISRKGDKEGLYGNLILFYQNEFAVETILYETQGNIELAHGIGISGTISILKKINGA